jgi:hypothetical protein
MAAIVAAVGFSLLISLLMSGLEALLTLVQQVSGTPYMTGGNSPAGTDCSGLASWVSNVASGRDAFSGRFHTANQESALLDRGFQYGTAPNAVVVGWNGYHTAVTLPDGTPVSAGESGTGVQVGGGGAYQPQFTHHMFLPLEPEAPEGPAPMGLPMFGAPEPPAPEPPPGPEPAPGEPGPAPA